MALLAVPKGERAGLARRLCDHARTADRHRAHTQKLHPRYGTGTLMSAAQGYQKVARNAINPTEFLFSLQILVDTLCACQRDQSS
ncbi:hypothetical protein [Cognatiyoonia sp. IB215182]|uniref:DUF7742 family protein n=1 Tax=Cognatiyoonia sp. IB215182 TaxID=3097353 RepID=UPI002A16AC6A|nr:hypothetical protein [Cognatiyoonia sp. IB215182]MDX8352208.1 hypothetical protein [Cognatiyoonia sp. IB215182]